MMTQVLYVTRHGETDWNRIGRLQGHTDIPLNETGRAQAQALGDKLRDMQIAAVGSSDLVRAHETAHIVARRLGVEHLHVDPDLRERAFGLFEGLTRTECGSRYPEEWTAWSQDSRSTPPGAEPHDVLSARALRAARRAAEVHARKKGAVLLVSHGGTIRALLHAIGAPPAGSIPNTALYRIEYSRGEFVSAGLAPGLEPLEHTA